MGVGAKHQGNAGESREMQRNARGTYRSGCKEPGECRRMYGCGCKAPGISREMQGDAGKCRGMPGERT